jgi:hypothetical protein
MPRGLEWFLIGIFKGTFNVFGCFTHFPAKGQNMARTHARKRAEALFARRQQQEAEGALAMAEYRRKQQHQLENLVRLRELRLERDRKRQSAAGVRKPS